MSLTNFLKDPWSVVSKQVRKEFERTWLGSLLGQALLMLIWIIAYVMLLAFLQKLIPDVLEALRTKVGDTIFYGSAFAPFGLILVFLTFPTAIRAWRQYRLSRQKFAWQSDASELFRLYPYRAADRAEFERPGAEDESAARWLQATPYSVNYLCGRSGVGKSSLVQAGLLPKLESTGWRTTVVRVDENPVERICQAILSVPDLLHGVEIESLPLAELLASVSQHIEQNGQPPLLIVIDQFEEFLILDGAHERRPLADHLRGLADSPLMGVRLLLVFRSDYRELLFKQNLPTYRLGENAFELAPFYRNEAQAFLQRGGLDMKEPGFDALFQGLNRIEGLHGLYRPITLNMVGLVMKRLPGHKVSDPSRLIELYLRQCLGGGVSRDLVQGVLACMISAEGTTERRSVADLASQTQLETWKITASLSEMESAGLVRSVSSERDVWEISHDFLARQISSLLGRMRPPWLQRYANPALVTAMVSWSVTIAVAVFLVWPELEEDKALNELANMGFSRTAGSEGHILILQDPDALTDASFKEFGSVVANLSDPVIDVRLQNTVITDLTPLEGMPLERLDLTNADGVTDLTPLNGMPLKRLDLLDVDGITDLTPLNGMPLAQIDLSYADGITDLTPLEGMQLKLLNLKVARGIIDLTPLEGMPLVQLDLSNADGITDLTPLNGMPLERLALTDVDGITDLAPLKGMPLVQLNLRNADGITDLTPLNGMPLERLALSYADGITDLTPLNGMPLKLLDLRNVDGITDLTPLKGMPLAELFLDGANGITDLTPLKGMIELTIFGASQDLLATMK